MIAGSTCKASPAQQAGRLPCLSKCHMEPQSGGHTPPWLAHIPRLIGRTHLGRAVTMLWERLLWLLLLHGYA